MGLFSYHYLAPQPGRTAHISPLLDGPSSHAPMQINGHGLALWVTSPFFLG